MGIIKRFGGEFLKENIKIKIIKENLFKIEAADKNSLIRAHSGLFLCGEFDGMCLSIKSVKIDNQ